MLRFGGGEFESGGIEPELRDAAIHGREELALLHEVSRADVNLRDFPDRDERDAHGLGGHAALAEVRFRDGAFADERGLHGEWRARVALHREVAEAGWVAAIRGPRVGWRDHFYHEEKSHGTGGGDEGEDGEIGSAHACEL